MKFKNILAIAILFTLPGFIYPSNGNYIFRTFSPSGGFYYDGIKSVQQDRDGFIWIMMDNDLFRFDGHEYRRYYTHFPEWGKSADWCFNNMIVDKSNQLFIATNDGLYVYNRTDDSFERVLNSGAEYVDIDARENIWIKTNGVLGIFNWKEKTVFYPKYNGQQVSYFRSILTTQNKDLYVLSNMGKLFRFDYDKNQFLLCHSQELGIENIGYILNAQISRGKLWVVIQNKGLYKLDLSTFKVEKIYNSFPVSSFPLRTLHIDKNENIWVGTMDGLYILDQSTNRFTHYRHSKDDKFSLPNNSVWTIREDLQRNIWIGTYSGRLCYVNLDEKNPFKTYSPQISQLNYAPVSTFAEDDKYLWIGTEGGGLNRMEKRTNKFDYYTHDEQNAQSITHNNIKSLVLDKKSNLWIGTFSGGLNHLNTDNGTFTSIKHNSSDRENSLLTNNTRKIIAESDSGLWITYQYKQLAFSFLSFKDKKITHHRFQNEDKYHYIFDILKGRDNKLWILGHAKLFVMDINSNEIQEVQHHDSLVLNGRSLTMDDSGNLWIGTVGKGLIKYNTNTSSFTQYKDILDYNVSSIYGVCYDNDSGVWMGTDNGLFKYDINKKHYSRFDENDGVQGITYYPLSVYKGLDDKIYFGGTNGFTSIDPRNLAVNRHKPHVIISDFYIDNEPIQKYQSTTGIHKEIGLNHDQINFGFMISSDNYLMPEKNQFKYRLRGYNDDWTLADGSHRLISYSKIPAGTYSFEVMAANNDGIWNETPEIIIIKRKSAPWFSWPAYILYSIFILGFAYIVYHYYNDKKRLKFQLYLDQIEKNKNDEIHESQLRFFTNISHDFRTPLSLILGIGERLREEGLKEYYYRILNGNSQRLLNLVNELMDFRAVENGKMSLEVEKVNINTFVNEIASTFFDYAKQHNQRFEIVCDKELSTPIYIDKYVMEKVIMNLLHNAFKYTPEKGAIRIETQCLSSSQADTRYKEHYRIENSENKGILQNSFSIFVRDTGIGISKESITRVFDRYYKVKTTNFDSHLGTGIGLALCKNLTLLHKGSITIYSERNKGTDIEVRFSKNPNAYKEDEIKCANPAKETNNSTIPEEKNTYDLPTDDTEGVTHNYKKKILLVEDNDDLRSLLRDFLSTDYDIIEAENGMVASQTLTDADIDLVLSDIMMPLKDGIALCAEVKDNVETSHIPFIMLSAKTSIESKIEGADSGADIYFEKPLDINLLKLSIENMFKQRELLKEYFAKNHFAESAELSMNERDNKFLKNLIDIIEKNIDKSDLDVNYIASELSMSRSKLYNKIKKMTGKSIVEFILSYRLRKAARMIIEEDMTMREIISCIGIESQPYFTNAFKKEFGKTPTAFATENKKHR